MAKSLTKRGGPKAASAGQSLLGPIFYPVDKVNVIAVCLGNQYTAHDLCFSDRRQQVEAKVEALLAVVEEDTPVNFQPCSVLAPILYTLHINDAAAANGSHLGLLADDTYIYTTRKHECHVLCKLQHGLPTVKS
jgi:hypothetical protein